MKKQLFKSIITALIAVGALSFSITVKAHDFWLSPENYHLEKPAIVDVSVMIGHPEDKLLWPLSPHRVVGLRSIGPDGIRDHQDAMRDYQPSESLSIRLEEEGLHILSIETTSAVSVLEAETFNDYLEEEGLTPIQVDRVIKRMTKKPGRETYSRRGKSLIQIGDLSETDPIYLSRPLGLTLEIVPLENPARLKEGEEFLSRVYFRGVPISRATIGLVDLDSEDGVLAVEKTDASGLVKFDRPEAGRWMLHVVWADTLPENDTAEYDTIFSSLSFEVY